MVGWAGSGEWEGSIRLIMPITQFTLLSWRLSVQLAVRKVDGICYS